MSKPLRKNNQNRHLDQTSFQEFGSAAEMFARKMLLLGHGDHRFSSPQANHEELRRQPRPTSSLKPSLNY